MGLAQERVQAWKSLMALVAKVKDPMLRNAMRAEFRERALRDWGYCPENNMTSDAPNIALDDWEKEFLADIKASQEYGIDMRKEKRAMTQAEAVENMREFIRTGHTLQDIPPEIRSIHIDELYYECLVSMGKDAMVQADQVIAAGPTEPIDVSDTDPFGGQEPTLESMTEWISKGGFWFNLPIEMQTQKNKDLYMQAMRQG